MPCSDTAMSVPAPGHLQVIQYQQQAADRDPDERERPLASALKCPRYPQYQRYLLDERYHASPQDRYVATRFGSQGRREEYHREQQLEERHRNQGQHERGYPQPGVPCPHLGQATSLPKEWRITNAIHRSAWKVHSAKITCRMLHKPCLATASRSTEDPGSGRRVLHIVVVDKDAQA